VTGFIFTIFQKLKTETKICYKNRVEELKSRKSIVYISVKINENTYLLRSFIDSHVSTIKFKLKVGKTEIR